MGKVFITIKNGTVYSIDGYKTDVEIDDDGNKIKMEFKSQEQFYDKRKNVHTAGYSFVEKDTQKE